MKKYKVKEILSEPRKAIIVMEGVVDQFWSTAVLMQLGDDVFESSVTFDNLEKSKSLKIGDVFER